VKELKVISLYFFLIVNLFSGLHLDAKSIVSGDIVEGQQYVPNFLKQKGHFEKNANGTTAYADAAGTRPVDGSGGAPTLSCTRTTSSPIDGDGSLLITKDAANRQGQGCTIQFTIDSAYKAKVLQIEFDYLVASGTFTAGSSSANSDLIVYIYDVTNSTLIEPSSIKLLSNSSTISDHFVANFQTSATGTTYNLILHQATTSSSAYTVKADNFVVKPSQYVYGTPITDWVSYTPTATNFGNGTTTGFWRRVGDSMQLSIRGLVGSSAPTGTILFSLPSGYTFDSTKYVSTPNVGNAIGAGSSAQYTGSVTTSGTSQFQIYQNAVSAAWNATNPVTWVSGNFITLDAQVPISGWSSSTQVSDGYDGRQIVFVGKNSASTSIATTGTYVPFTSQKDSTASWSTDTFTCPSFGDYEVKAGLHGSSTSNYFYAQVDKNGALYARILQNESRGDRLASGSVIVYNCSAGETIKLKAYSDTSSQTLNSSADLNFITISKLSSPQTMSATEVVAAQGNISSTLTTTNSLLTLTITKDTHGAVSSSVFTAPVAGFYAYNAQLRGVASTAQTINFGVAIDGALSEGIMSIYSGTTNFFSVHTSGMKFLNAGQTISFRGYTDMGTYSNGGNTHWSIYRIK